MIIKQNFDIYIYIYKLTFSFFSQLKISQMFPFYKYIFSSIQHTLMNHKKTLLRNINVVQFGHIYFFDI